MLSVAGEYQEVSCSLANSWNTGYILRFAANDISEYQDVMQAYLKKFS